MDGILIPEQSVRQLWNYRISITSHVKKGNTRNVPPLKIMTNEKNVENKIEATIAFGDNAATKEANVAKYNSNSM